MKFDFYRTARLVALLVTSLLTVFGCKDDDETVSQPPRMELWEAPTSIPSNVDRTSRFEVRITGENLRIDSVLCEVFAPGGGVHSQFALMDDGSLDSLWGPDYAGHLSGDIVPSNGRFTRSINGMALANQVTGDYRFVFTPIGETRGLEPQTLTVTFAEVTDCIMTSITHFHELPACFTEFPLEVRVRPSQPDIVDSVRMLLLAGTIELGRIEFVPASGDTFWSASLGPTFLQCVGSSDHYIIQYEAITEFGLMCTDSFHGVSIENDLPVLSNPQMPDTVYRPTETGRVDTFDVFVNFHDCELLGEAFYYGVKYSVRREDRTEWSDSTVFFMRDDGLSHDPVASDGIFTAALTVDRRDDLPDFLYYFRFYAIDCAPPYDSSAFVYDSVRIIQPHTLIQFPPGEHLGISAGEVR